MTKTDKLPRVIEVSDGHYAVSIGDDVTVQWWKSKNGVWSVQVKAETGGLDVLDVHHEKAIIPLH